MAESSRGVIVIKVFGSSCPVLFICVYIPISFIVILTSNVQPVDRKYILMILLIHS